MQKCVDKNDRRRCHEGYRYDESKKICVKSSCPPGQVYRKNITKKVSKEINELKQT